YTLAAGALAGLPFLSGFLSKEMILLGSLGWAMEGGGIRVLVPLLAVITSLLTAWYIGRQWSLVFLGNKRTAGLAHIREGNPGMKVPMLVLGIFTLFIWFSPNPFGTPDIALMKALSPAGGAAAAVAPAYAAWALLLLAVLLVPAMLYASYRKFSGIVVFSRKEKPLEEFLSSGWRLDTAYNAIFVGPLLQLGKFMQLTDDKVVNGILHLLGRLSIRLSRLAAWWDKYIVDGMVNFTAARARSLGDFFRGFQTGRVQQYMALAVFSLMVLYLIKILTDQ
ncbi:MAG TPA: hypothetical protein VD772_03010, partial [Anseongella sp.]|nr:hypothetical protein [Anseongella sp.]